MQETPLQPDPNADIVQKATSEAEDTSMPGREEEVIDQSVDSDINPTPEPIERTSTQCLETKADTANAG